jgi:rubrerythrin
VSGIEQFSGYEVVKAAMEVEKHGQRFYAAMAQRAEQKLARDLFAWLAQDEVEHLRRLKSIEGKFAEGASFADEEEFLPYLRRFSESEIFPSAERIERVLQQENADQEALALAIEAEEKFAAYFAKAAELAREADGREAFAWLAGEERRHAALLKERKEQLASVRAPRANGGGINEKRSKKRQRKRIPLRYGTDAANKVAFTDDITHEGLFVRAALVMPPAPAWCWS